MNRQATIISWLALAGGIFYSCIKSWDSISYLLRDARSLGWIDFAELFQGDAAWLLGLSVTTVVMMAPWIRKSLIRLRCLQPEGIFTEDLAVVLNTIGRWLLGICLLLGLRFADNGNFFLLLFAGMLVTPEVALLASSGFTGFIDGVFFPGSREKKPPYSLKLARFYVEKNRWEDADAEFTRVLAWHPEQLEAWQERLRAAQTHAWKSVAFAESEAPDTQAILAQGLKCLKSPADKEALFAEYNRLRNGGPHTHS